MGVFYMRKDKGFTLLEMMVVIAIMAIVFAIAVPNIYSYAAGMKLRSASRDLYSTLQKARMNAIRQNIRWAVEFTFSTYVVVDCGPNNVCGGSGATDDIPHGATNISSYSGINMTDFPGIIEFYPDGTSNGGTITFEDLGHTSQVVVSVSGRVKSS